MVLKQKRIRLILKHSLSFQMKMLALTITMLCAFCLLNGQTREELMKGYTLNETPVNKQKKGNDADQYVLYRPILGYLDLPQYKEQLTVETDYHPEKNWTDKKGKVHTEEAYTLYSYEYKEGYQERALERALALAKQRFPGNVGIIDLKLNDIRNEEPRNAYVTFSPTASVEWIDGAFIPKGVNKSMFLHASESAAVKAVTEALKEIQTNAKIGVYISQSKNIEINNMVFDAIEETLFSLGYKNIVDRTDIDVTRYEQQLRSGFEFQDASVVGFFSGADYVITARIDKDRIAIRVLDIRTSTLKGRGTVDF